MTMIVIMMMNASYTNDDVDNDRIIHASTTYDATNFLTDGGTRGVGYLNIRTIFNINIYSDIRSCQICFYEYLFRHSFV